jgi:tripartite-type tricarboxylate transporter receptor subunit TctC
MFRHRNVRIAGRGLAFALFLAWHGGAQAADVTFSRQIQFVLGTAAGGGTDLEARLIGHYIGKYLPGQPQIVFRNIPGGNGVKAITYFVRQVKPDGYTVLYASNSRLNPLNVRKHDADFDPARFAMIGGSAADGTIVMARKEAIPRITDPAARPVVMGSVDGGKSGIQMMVWGAEFLNWNLRWVVGYAGTTATMLALRSGEIEMASTGSLFQIKPLLDSGEFVAFAQLGDRDADGAIHPRPPFDDVPLFPSMVAGKLTGKDQAAFRAWMNALQVNKWVGLPPNTPAPIVAAWREAYRKAARDPEFLADVRKQIDTDWQPLAGETIQAIVTELSQTPDDVLQVMVDYRKKHGLPTEELRAAKAVGAGGAVANKVHATIAGVEDGGRMLKFSVAGAMQTAKVSSGRTEIRVGGKEGKRSDLKAGLECEIAFDKSGGEATRVDCN